MVHLELCTVRVHRRLLETFLVAGRCRESIVYIPPKLLNPMHMQAAVTDITHDPSTMNGRLLPPTEETNTVKACPLELPCG